MRFIGNPGNGTDPFLLILRDNPASRAAAITPINSLLVRRQTIFASFSDAARGKDAEAHESRSNQFLISPNAQA